MAIDLFDLGDTPEKLAKALGRSSCRWLVMSFTSDWLFPPFQSQEIVEGLIATERPVSYCNVQTDCGHDAFLLPNQVGIYGEMIRAFLANLIRDEGGGMRGEGRGEKEEGRRERGEGSFAVGQQCIPPTAVAPAARRMACSCRATRASFSTTGSIMKLFWR